MNELALTNLLTHFARVSQRLNRKLGTPDLWQDFYGEMCFVFARENGNLKDKPLAYTIKVCKNRALNTYFRGKSIDTKIHVGIKIISFDALSENTPMAKRFEEGVHNKMLADRILGRLTEREKQVAELIMEGNTENEMAVELGMSQQRVNYLKNRIRIKAKTVRIYGL